MIGIVVILIICAFFVTVINIYCIAIILYCRKLHKPAHIAILSLLVGHSIQGIIVLPVYAYERSDIEKAKGICDVFRFSYLFTNYTCCLSVLVISLDRFIAIKFPFRYQVGFTSKRMTRLLVFVWGYVFLLCTIPFLPSDRNDNCYYNPQKEWVLTMLFGHTLIPFIIIIFCYVVIYKEITAVLRRRTARGVSSLGDIEEETRSIIERGHRNIKFRNQLNKTNVTLIIVAAYVFCWGPSLFYYLLLTLCKSSCFHKNFHKKFSANFDESSTKEITGFVIKFLTLFDGFLSPLIYCCTNHHFNTERKALLVKFKNKIWCSKAININERSTFDRHTLLQITDGEVSISDGGISPVEKLNVNDVTFLPYSYSTETVMHLSTFERQPMMHLSTFDRQPMMHLSTFDIQTLLSLNEMKTKSSKRTHSCAFWLTRFDLQ